MPKYKASTAKLKAKKLVKAYSKAGFNQSRLAKREGVSQAAIHDRLSKAPVQKTLIALANKMGLSDRRLVKKHNQLLDAKRTQSCDVYIQNENGKYKVNENSNDFIEVDDNQAQANALKLAYQIKGHLKDNIDQSQHIHLTIEEKNARFNRLKNLMSVE